MPSGPAPGAYEWKTFRSEGFGFATSGTVRMWPAPVASKVWEKYARSPLGPMRMPFAPKEVSSTGDWNQTFGAPPPGGTRQMVAWNESVMYRFPSLSNTRSLMSGGLSTAVGEQGVPGGMKAQVGRSGSAEA